MDSKPMIVPTSQGDVIIDISVLNKPPYDEVANNVGVRISGGADSAILAYMLAIYKRDYRPHITLHPITCVNDKKPYQEIYAKNVIKKITELTGVEFGEHFVKNIDGSEYVKNQKLFVEELYSKRKLDLHYMGETMNPPLGLEEEEDWFFDGGGRDHSRDELGDVHTPVCIYRPLRNINKKGTRELYEHFGVLDTLYPITRSCEMQTDSRYFKSFDDHCGRCWFCLERFWGFGRYV